MLDFTGMIDECIKGIYVRNKMSSDGYLQSFDDANFDIIWTEDLQRIYLRSFDESEYDYMRIYKGKKSDEYEIGNTDKMVFDKFISEFNVVQR